MEQIRIAQSEVLEADIAHIEARSDFEILSERNQAVKQQLENMRGELDHLGRIVTECHKTYKETHAEIAGPLRNAMLEDEALDAFIKEFSEKRKETTVAEVNEEIEAERAKLELMQEGDGNIIVRYEERARRIAKLTSHVGKLAESLAEVSGKIETIQHKYEPELDRLVRLISDSFSYNMEQIGCAGQVSVGKPGRDFDEWAVNIAVKFRENEGFSQLDDHRQSGGERAVSTVFYLMSLQTLTRSPFRVVDEINQGMDPRNERLVHARMVAIATGTDEYRPPAHLLEPVVARAEQNGHAGDNDDADVAVEGPTAAQQNSDSDDDDTGARRPGRVQIRGADDSTGVVGGQGSQYFLITPKLLHELNYAPGMRVLCIASGEHMVEGVDFQGALQIKKSLAMRTR